MTLVSVTILLLSSLRLASPVVCSSHLLLQYVEAYVTVHVDVGVEHWRAELELRARVRVIAGEHHGQLEKETFVRGAFRAGDGGVPLEKVVAIREGSDSLRRCGVWGGVGVWCGMLVCGGS